MTIEHEVVDPHNQTSLLKFIHDFCNVMTFPSPTSIQPQWEYVVRLKDPKGSRWVPEEWWLAQELKRVAVS
jgi:hypothetical protein